MQTLTLSKKKENESIHRNPSKKSQTTTKKPQQIFQTLYMPIIQRNPICVCDGGCPICIDESYIHSKLKISQPSDIYEQEADRLADQIMEISHTSQHDKYNLIQSTIPQKEVNLIPNAGRPFPPTLSSYFSEFYNCDVSRTRIHTNSRAMALAKRLNAKAFTVGHDIVFGEGQYAPNTKSGIWLIAHELAHVYQQANSRSSHQIPEIQRESAQTVSSNLKEICFAASVPLIGNESSIFGSLVAEPIIFMNYCSSTGYCFPGNVYFDVSHFVRDFINFLHAIKGAPLREEIEEQSRKDFKRPDIISINPPEYYEIKPNSPSGRSAGSRKLDEIQYVYMNKWFSIFIRGVSYTPSPPSEWLFDYGPIRVYLNIQLFEPGLLLYDVCIEGDENQIDELVKSEELFNEFSEALEDYIGGITELKPEEIELEKTEKELEPDYLFIPELPPSIQDDLRSQINQQNLDPLTDYVIIAPGIFFFPIIRISADQLLQRYNQLTFPPKTREVFELHLKNRILQLIIIGTFALGQYSAMAGGGIGAAGFAVAGRGATIIAFPVIAKTAEGVLKTAAVFLIALLPKMTQATEQETNISELTEGIEKEKQSIIPMILQEKNPILAVPSTELEIPGMLKLYQKMSYKDKDYYIIGLISKRN